MNTSTTLRATRTPAALAADALAKAARAPGSPIPAASPRNMFDGLTAPKGSAPVNQKKANALGFAAQGEAEAKRIIRQAMSEGETWMATFARILELDKKARGVLVDYLKAWRTTTRQTYADHYEVTAKDGTKSVKVDAKTTPKATIEMVRTATVRVNEAVIFADACNKGMTRTDIARLWNEQGLGKKLAFGDMTHAACVYAARHCFEPTTNRGAKKLPVAVKAGLYLLRTYNAKQIADIAAAMPALARKVATLGIDKALESLKPAKPAKA